MNPPAKRLPWLGSLQHGCLVASPHSSTGTLQVMERVPPDAMLDDIQLEMKPFQILYTEGDLVHVMDTASFEQLTIPSQAFGDQKQYIVPDSEITLKFYQDQVVQARVASQVTLSVKELQPAAPKADGSLLRPAFLENGLRVQVPTHVNEGDAVIIRTEDSSFVKKVST